ncbi:hypothetical protein MHYP_G00166640 [Metynnis hypsauchen]
MGGWKKGQFPVLVQREKRQQQLRTPQSPLQRPPHKNHRQANMRKMKVKRPEKDTATTAKEDDQESSLRGAPSVGEKQYYTKMLQFHCQS